MPDVRTATTISQVSIQATPRLRSRSPFPRSIHRMITYLVALMASGTLAVQPRQIQAGPTHQAH